MGPIFGPPGGSVIFFANKAKWGAIANKNGGLGYSDVLLRPWGGSVIRTQLGRRALPGYLGGFHFLGASSLFPDPGPPLPPLH